MKTFVRNSGTQTEKNNFCFLPFLGHLFKGKAPTTLPHLHCADAQAPVDYKLTESCRPFVAVPPVHHQ